MTTTKRLIRFSRGELAGQFRYVSSRSGCVSGPETVSEPTGPAPAQEAADSVSNPTAATGETSLSCAEKQADADAFAARMAATGRQTTFTPAEVDAAIRATMPDPTFTKQDVERMQEFQQTHPTHPIDRVANIAGAMVEAVQGLLLGWGAGIQAPEQFMLAPRDTPFKTMLEVFK